MVFDVEGVFSYQIGAELSYSCDYAFSLSLKGCLPQTIDSLICLNLDYTPVASVPVVDKVGLYILYLQSYRLQRNAGFLFNS